MINRIFKVGLLCFLVFGLEGCFLSGGEYDPSPAPGLGIFRVGDERVFRRVISRVSTSNPGIFTERYDIHVKAERFLVQDGLKRMIFRVSRPGFDDSIATDTLIDGEWGLVERASADFGRWYPDPYAGTSGALSTIDSMSVMHRGERFVVTMGWSLYDMHGGPAYDSECLADSVRGPLYGCVGHCKGVNNTSYSPTLTLLSLNGKSIDVDSLRALFPRHI